MKKLALSVVVLMVASAGVSISGAGCSSSSSTGTSSSSSGGTDATADTSSGGDDSSSSSSGSDSSSSSSGGDSSSSSGSDATACSVPDSGGIPVSGLDGGENTACESCIGASCCNEQNACIFDTNMVVGDDAGTMFPGCDVYLNCVYPELTQLLLTTDAGLMGAATQAETDCAGADGGNFAAGSVTAGNALLSCIGLNCASTCIP